MGKRVAVGRDSCGTRAAPPAGLAAAGRQFGLGLVLLRLDLLGVAAASVMSVRLGLGDRGRHSNLIPAAIHSNFDRPHVVQGSTNSGAPRRLQHHLVVGSSSNEDYVFFRDALG